MEQAALQIKKVEEKVQQLVRQYQLAQKEIKTLQKENARLSSDLQMRIKHADELQQKIDTSSLSTMSMDADAKKDLAKKIDAYLKEIDNCIALLNS